MRGRRLLIGVAALSVCLSACVDTTSKPSSMTADPHAVAALAMTIGKETAPLPNSQCVAYEAFKRLTAAQIATMSSDAKPSGADLTAVLPVYDACMTTEELSRTLVQAFGTGAEFVLVDAELSCAAGAMAHDPKYKKPSLLVGALAADQDATLRVLLEHLGSCLSRESVVAWMTKIFSTKTAISAGMTQCIVPRLIDQYGGPAKFMNALVAAGAGNTSKRLELLSIGVAKQCASAGVR